MVTPYTNISQSSNVNTSYRYGTPILASDIPGLRQFVLPGKTGFLIDLKSPLKNWINALDIITKNQADMSKNCIDYYNRNFAEPNWVKYIDKLFV